MPENAVIVGMSTLPLSMEISGEQARLLLPEGRAQIDYIFGAPPPGPTPPIPEADADNSLIIIGIAAAAAAGLAVAVYSRRARRLPAKPPVESEARPETKALDPQTIFRLRPDLREDDKAIVSFIYESGGQARESDLRKKFLQPRTTMWRAVKRLERRGVIEIEKRDQQNLVRLKDELEGEQ